MDLTKVRSPLQLHGPVNSRGTYISYKLHGSVTYYGDRDAQKANRFFRLDRGYPLPSPNFRLTREGNALEPLMVLPTLEKRNAR